jgi:hypothetical protein
MLPINQQLSEDHGPEIGTFEAAYELASMDTFMGGLARNSALDDMDGPSAKKLTPEVLNEKYPGMAVPFNKPMSDVAAFHLHEETQKRNDLQRIISEGPKGTFYNQVTNIGANLVAHALDPVEFGVGTLAGFGIKGVGMLIKGSQAAASSAGIAKFGEALTKSSFAVEATEGILGNAALEPAMYQQQKRAQVDYGIEDAFLSVVGGGLAMPVLKKAFHSVIGLPDSVTGMAWKSSIGQAQEGFRPTPELHAQAYNDIAFKNPDNIPVGSVRAEYKFSPMDVAAHQDKTFYMAGASINESKTIGDFLGEGSYLTDNPNFANNIAAHPMDDSIGDVFEVKLNNTKLFDADTKFDLSKRPWEAEGYKLVPEKTKDGWDVRAYDKDGNEVGHYEQLLGIVTVEEGKLSGFAHTKEGHQRKGLASSAYELIEKESGRKIVPDGVQTDAGQALWASNNRAFGDDGKKSIVLSDKAKETLQSGNSLKESLLSLDEADQKSVLDAIKAQGYDGLSMVDSAKGHNAVHLFPEAAAKIQEQSRFKSDPKAVPSLDPKVLDEMTAKARSRENEIGFDPALDKEFSEFALPEEFKSIESSKLEADMDDTMNRLSSMDKEGFLSQESKEILETVKQSKMERQSRLEVIKDFATCLLSGV